MKFRIVLEYDPEAKSFSAVCPELPGCASAGDTEDEARRNIKEAIALYLEPSDIELPQHASLQGAEGLIFENLDSKKPGALR
jgi:predicted RNase H-like HicB family nuclease